jgi:hypothetical protein
MLAQGRDYVQLKTRSAVLESDCLDFLFDGMLYYQDENDNENTHATSAKKYEIP